MLTETDESSQVLDAITVDKIDHFLKPKRRSEVFFTLDKLGELSQKELADTISITATALSNILVVFTKFEIQLLKFKNVGKYRFYSLSQVGQTYCRVKKSYLTETEAGIDGETTKLICEARSAIEEFVNLSPLSWENIMSALLEKRLYRHLLRDVKGRYGIEDDVIDKAEQLIDQYITCIEKAELNENETAVNGVLELIPNSVIRERISDVVEVFNEFSFVLKAHENPKDAIKAYLSIKKKFDVDVKPKMRNDSDEIRTEKDDYTPVEKTVQKLVCITKNLDEEGVCLYLRGIMPGQTLLCVYIARCICGR